MSEFMLREDLGPHPKREEEYRQRRLMDLRLAWLCFGENKTLARKYQDKAERLKKKPVAEIRKSRDFKRMFPVAR